MHSATGSARHIHPDMPLHIVALLRHVNKTVAIRVRCAERDQHFLASRAAAILRHLDRLGLSLSPCIVCIIVRDVYARYSVLQLRQARKELGSRDEAVCVHVDIAEQHGYCGLRVKAQAAGGLAQPVHVLLPLCDATIALTVRSPLGTRVISVGAAIRRHE